MKSTPRTGAKSFQIALYVAISQKKCKLEIRCSIGSQDTRLTEKQIWSTFQNCKLLPFGHKTTLACSISSTLHSAAAALGNRESDNDIQGQGRFCMHGDELHTAKKPLCITTCCLNTPQDLESQDGIHQHVHFSV
jgi:hypothetical protein